MTPIENRCTELRAEVWPLGRRVYADKAKAFVRRMRVLYEKWRDEHVAALGGDGGPGA